MSLGFRLYIVIYCTYYNFIAFKSLAAGAMLALLFAQLSVYPLVNVGNAHDLYTLKRIFPRASASIPPLSILAQMS